MVGSRQTSYSLLSRRPMPKKEKKKQKPAEKRIRDKEEDKNVATA